MGCILLYLMTSRKITFNVLLSSTAHVTYWYVKKYLQQMGKEETAGKEIPDDCIFVFDNNKYCIEHGM